MSFNEKGKIGADQAKAADLLIRHKRSLENLRYHVDELDAMKKVILSENKGAGERQFGASVDKLNAYALEILDTFDKIEADVKEDVDTIAYFDEEDSRYFEVN